MRHVAKCAHTATENLWRGYGMCFEKACQKIYTNYTILIQNTHYDWNPTCEWEEGQDKIWAQVFTGVALKMHVKTRSKL